MSGAGRLAMMGSDGKSLASREGVESCGPAQKEWASSKEGLFEWNGSWKKTSTEKKHLPRKIPSYFYTGDHDKRFIRP